MYVHVIAYKILALCIQINRIICINHKQYIRSIIRPVLKDVSILIFIHLVKFEKCLSSTWTNILVKKKAIKPFPKRAPVFALER